MRRFGMPMGPFEAVDEVGLAVAVKVAGVLAKAFPAHMSEATSPQVLVADGRLGRKSGRGFYRHAGRSPAPDPTVRGPLGLRAARPPPNLEPLVEPLVRPVAHHATPRP